MKITNIRCRALTGTLEFPGVFWEERLSRPIDIYPEHRAEGPDYSSRLAEGKYRMHSIFIEVDTDAGIVGLSGPVGGGNARIILSEFKDLLLGEDPRAVELLWDKMHRLAVHGRKGSTMMAISALDCALWDIRGKWANAPVYQLLGGPTRTRIPAYASMLGFSVEPEQAAQRAREYAAKGYTAQKWFFRASPADGMAGIRKNVALVQAVREAIGEDHDLMLDCWMSWDLYYARQMAPRIAPYNPRWIEEPAMPDKPEICAQIRQAVPFPVSNGEHEYTRWGFKHLLEIGAQDVLQPDIYWCGGITETLKIAALASAYDVAVIPHGHSSHATAHFLAAQSPHLCPIQEYLVKWNTVHQFFLKHKVEPVDGYIEVPQQPGLGLEIDEDVVEEETILD
ncbi:MAG TPA: mandelate racemase/muconate lactonizing protein [Chloroflexi bacterium]|jgi:L-rhamnonate dehydratase|nr:mandelate racemase/muconate lactonizing protein [Chloroflexota bacterium]